MNQKKERLLAIKKLIARERIVNQDELLLKLNREGFSITQATLSRDLKRLGAARIPDARRGYIYVLSQKDPELEISGSENSTLLSGFISIGFSSNFGVIKTLPGYASGIALFIDKQNRHEILGTIAGDDTILVIPSEGATRRDIVNALAEMEPDLAGRLEN